MKTIRIITQLAILASMGLTSCQEYEAGFTADDIFRGGILYDGRTDSSFEQLYREADKRLYLSKQIKGCQLTV